MAKGLKPTDLVRLRPATGVFATAIAWAIVVGGVAAAAVLLVGAQRSAAIYWGVICSAGVLAAAVAVIRVRLEIDVYEVRVFNVPRTYHIPWGAVAQIDTVGLWPSPGALLVIADAVRIRTNDGRRVVVDASNGATSTVLRELAKGSSQRRVRSPS